MRCKTGVLDTRRADLRDADWFAGECGEDEALCEVSVAREVHWLLC